jgi:hypothetical protein
VLVIVHSASAIDALERVSNRRESYPESFVNRLTLSMRTLAICLSRGTEAFNGGRVGTVGTALLLSSRYRLRKNGSLNLCIKCWIGLRSLLVEVLRLGAAMLSADPDRLFR